jgi:cell division protein FtsZ
VNVDFADVRTVMANGGSALMGTGIGRGDNRSIEAAQQAIASPLLDNVSIAGATGVLVNITGGADLTLGEVHQINEIIHDAVGDEAEIIFGAVHEPAMQGEIRVTVIATGFDRALQTPVSGPSIQEPSPALAKSSPVIPFPGNRPVRTGTIARPNLSQEAARPRQPGAERSSGGSQDLSDMEIPTFIRRQMD